MLPAYNGITDFTDFGQVPKMLKVFNECRRPDSTRKLHVGVMMSYKTLNGIPSKWQNAFPPKEKIASIFGSLDTYNCLHYADYDNNPELWKTLAIAIGWGGPGIHAVQLDMIWPDPGEIAEGVYYSRKNVEVILQIGRNAMEAAHNDPHEVVERLADYEGVIHRVLLDKSMGKGVPMDPFGLLEYARAIRRRYLDLGIGFAGGLGPGRVGPVATLAAEMPDASYDAQSWVRPSGSALDPVDWMMAAQYLTEMAPLTP